MSIICRTCGYENEDGSTVCEICAEDLTAPVSQEPVRETTVETAPEEKAGNCSSDDGTEYFVVCPESQTRTILPSGDVTSYYCEGCGKEHEIDGFIWAIEEKSADVGQSGTNTVKSCCRDILCLEELTSHAEIEITKPGGTVGRYAAFGSDFFLSRGLHKISGEHCSITFEDDEWVLRHLSRSNDTVYDTMKLSHGEPRLIEEGKILRLANTISFVIRFK